MKSLYFNLNHDLFKQKYYQILYKFNSNPSLYSFDLIILIIKQKKILVNTSLLIVFSYLNFQVKNTFRTPSWWDHHETWKDMRYDWLPSWQEIPKHLHERPHLSHLDELQVNIFSNQCVIQILEKNNFKVQNEFEWFDMFLFPFGAAILFSPFQRHLFSLNLDAVNIDVKINFVVALKGYLHCRNIEPPPLFVKRFR